MSRPEKISIIVFSGEFDKIHYALVTAAAAAAIDIPATLFFTMAASRALLAPDDDGRPAWRNLPPGHSGAMGPTAGRVDDGFKERTVANFEDLLTSCVALGVKFMVCDMGLRALDLEGAQLRHDVPIETGGMVTFLNDASASGQMLFI
ncbi:MAG TPA: hypothetical protein ENI69_02965 [Rhodospirillales bacterium]|nr:hypothetical protein [Rhodospirillales bacterium]